MRLGKTALYHFATQLCISAAGFLATFVIATVLGAGDLGLYSVAVGVGYFWLAIPGKGVADAVRKRMSEGTEAAQYFGGGLAVNALLATGIGALVLLAGRVLAVVDAPDVVFVAVFVEYDLAVATLLVGATLLRTGLAGLEGQKLVARSGGMKAVERVARSAVQIGLVAGGFGVAAIAFGHAATLALVGLLALFVAAHTRPAVPDWSHVRSLGEYARYAWVGALRSRVYGWLDTLVLSLFLGGATLIGVYEVAWGIGSLLGTASASIGRTLFPELSDLSSDGNYERVTHFLDEAVAFGGVIVVPGLVGAVVVGERVLRFYRPEYVQGTTVLVILVAAYVADTYANQLLNVVNAVDRPDAAMRVNLAFVVTNVVLNVVLVWQVGWQGAAVATATSAVVRLLGGYVALTRILEEVRLPLGAVAQEGFAALCMGAVVFATRGAVPRGRGYTVALVAFGVAVYLAVLLVVSARVRNKARSLVPAA